MRIVFIGTVEFSFKALEALIDIDANVVGICTKENSTFNTDFVDISNFIDKKIEIMNIFQSEIGEHPFPRSEKNIRALGTLRGAISNCEYAESFILLKSID